MPGIAAFAYDEVYQWISAYNVGQLRPRSTHNTPKAVLHQLDIADDSHSRSHPSKQPAYFAYWVANAWLVRLRIEHSLYAELSIDAIDLPNLDL